MPGWILDGLYLKWKRQPEKNPSKMQKYCNEKKLPFCNRNQKRNNFFLVLHFCYIVIFTFYNKLATFKLCIAIISWKKYISIFVSKNKIPYQFIFTEVQAGQIILEINSRSSLLGKKILYLEYFVFFYCRTLALNLKISCLYNMNAGPMTWT